MYSDIIPPNKTNKLSKIKAKKEKVLDIPEVIHRKDEPFVQPTEVYHTAYGQDRKSKLPAILVVLTLISLSIVYYSVFNNKTNISFESKSTIFEVKDNIPMSLAEKNQIASTTLSYNLIYNNENKDRNIFAPTVEESTSTLKAVTSQIVEYYTLNNSTTSPTVSKKVKLINESNINVQVIKDTRFDVGGVTYYIDKAVDIKKTVNPATTTSKYKVIGFKGTANYEKFYAVDYVDTNTNSGIVSTSTTDANSPNSDILSLIPENFISLKKNYVYDKNINQSALVVIDKKDFEKVLIANSKLVQEYVKSFNTIFDLVEYEISINDYELELDPTTGLPISFKNLNLEIIPKIKKDKVAATFKGFSKETMRKIKNEIAKNITMNVSYSPFWVSKVSDEDHISVEVK